MKIKKMYILGMINSCYSQRRCTLEKTKLRVGYVTKEDFKDFEAYLTKLGILRADVVFEAKLKNKAVNQILKPIGEGYWKLA